MAGSEDVTVPKKLITLINIDGDIQLPPNVDGKGRPTPFPFRLMSVGDSFFTMLPGVRGAAQYARRMGYGKFTCRKWKEDGAVGIRVWRVE